MPSDTYTYRSADLKAFLEEHPVPFSLLLEIPVGSNYSLRFDDRMQPRIGDIYNSLQRCQASLYHHLAVIAPTDNCIISFSPRQVRLLGLPE